MKVQVEITSLSTSRREGTPDQLVVKELCESDNGNWEVEVSGPRAKVIGWLKRNGYNDGEYTVIEF